MSRFGLAVLIVWAALFAACNQQPSADFSASANAAMPLDAEAVLRQLADFYRRTTSFQVEYEQTASIGLDDANGADDIEKTLKSRTSIAFERPNRLAMRQKDSDAAPDVFCDGRQLSISLPPIRRYTQSAAPTSLEELRKNPLVMGGHGGPKPLLELFSDNPYAALMKGVVKVEYIGRTKVDDLDVHQLKFIQKKLDWELWIAANGQPRVVQAVFDFTRSNAAIRLGDKEFKTRTKSIQRYKNWQFDVRLEKDRFAFEPPAGSMKVDSFFTGGSTMRANDAEATEGLEEVWSKPGAYSGVAVAADGKTIMAVQRQTADFFDAAGEKSRTVNLAAPGGLLRCARLTGEEPGELLVYEIWTGELNALKSDGSKLWQQERGEGIDDVWAADLDGDGKDEVIVGYNGGTGLQVFGSGGQRLWQDTSVANVWRVAAGDLDGDGVLEVVTTSAIGKIHLFDAQGTKRPRLDPGIYAHMVRAFRLPGKTADHLLVVGKGKHGLQNIALDGKGEPLWRTVAPGDVKNCDSLAFSPNSTWVAAGYRGGLLCVMDVRFGKIIAAATNQGVRPQVAWVSAHRDPLLVVATGSALTAWRVKRAEAPVAAEK